MASLYQIVLLGKWILIKSLSLIRNYKTNKMQIQNKVV